MVIFKKIRFKVYFTCTYSIEHEIIQKSLSFDHPEPYNVPVYNERKSNGERKWDGIVRMYAVDDSFHIGLLSYPKEALIAKNATIKYINFEVQDFSHIKFSDSINTIERDYQRAAIIKSLQEKIGVTVVPTRGGKTYIAGETMRILLELSPQSNVLFITDTLDGFKQLPADLMPFIDKFVKEVGVIGDDKRIFNQVTIGMVQTIQTCLKRPKKERTIKDKEMLKYLDTINVLMIDEIHEHMSDARIGLIKYMVWRKLSKVEYFLEYSATPWKKSDVLGTLRLKKYTGGEIYRITQKDLEDRKVLAKSKILLVINEIEDFTYNDDDEYQKLRHSLIYESDERNWILLTIIQICIELDLKTMVMFSSKAHGYSISESTGLQFLSGDDNIFKRKLTKDEFLCGKGKTLLVSEIWKKAITLPEVEVFVNADGGKEDTLITQKKGRVLGVTDTKTKAVIIDIIDICDVFFSDHSLSRISAYEETNLPDDIDTMNSDVYFYDNLKQYLQEWFNDDI